MPGKRNSYTAEEVLQHIFADEDSDKNEKSVSEDDESNSSSGDTDEEGNTSNSFSVSPMPNSFISNVESVCLNSMSVDSVSVDSMLVDLVSVESMPADLVSSSNSTNSNIAMNPKYPNLIMVSN